MATFYVDITPSSPTTATLYASVTGGDPSFTEYRWIELDISGVITVDIQSNNQGGDSSYWNATINGLDPNTTYSYSAMLGYEDQGQIIWVPSYTEYGSFTTPPAGGNAYIYCDLNGVTDWHSATPYIYTSSGWEPVSAHVYTSGGWS